MTGEVDPRYQVTFQAAPHALLAVDPAGVVRLASAEAERLFGREDTALLGRRLDEVLTSDPTVPLRAGCTPDPDPPCRPSPMPVLAASAVRLPDGQQLPVNIRMHPVRARGDNLHGWVIMAVDDPGETVRSRAALEHRVVRLTEAEHEQDLLMGNLIRAQERERARIAAGIHDDTLQVIAAAMLRLQRLRRKIRDGDVVAMLVQVEESIAAAADRLRRLTFDVRPLALERSGLGAALREALGRLRDDAGVEVRLEDRLSAEPPMPTRLLLYRIAQEALANVGKHAAADLVVVTLLDRDKGYLVKVADDGIGTTHTRRAFLPEPGHLGLMMMRERAEFAGGWFRIDSARASGTTVTAWVPQGADVETAPRPPPVRGQVGRR